MKKILLKIGKVIFILYILICVLLFFFQEKIIFFPEKLAPDYKFRFTNNFEEINSKTTEGNILNSLLFRTTNSKGLIFYLHGNAGSLASWGEEAKVYTDLGYDVFMIDYPGYGKSEGSIKSQEQLFQDIQQAYNLMLTKYKENQIIVLGYSIGTGLAAKVTADNHPKMLILQAPYFSLKDMMKHTFPIIPTFLLKYKFETNKYLQNCKMPIVIFHGNADEVIYYGSSLKLKQLFKSSDILITLKNAGHNGMSYNQDYQKEIKKILN